MSKSLVKIGLSKPFVKIVERNSSLVCIATTGNMYVQYPFILHTQEKISHMIKTLLWKEILGSLYPAMELLILHSMVIILINVLNYADFHPAHPQDGWVSTSPCVCVSVCVSVCV